MEMKNNFVVHNIHGSNFGNMMIKYLVARQLARSFEHVKLSNYDMPYWGLSIPGIEDRGDSRYEFSDDQRINLSRARQLLVSGLFTSFEMRGHFQRMENLADAADAKDCFVAASDIGCKFGNDFIVCPIRGGETLGAIHSGYTLLPINFYADIFVRTGLKPVFCGQTEPNPYVDTLRARFPNAIFLPSQGALADFQTIRSSANIIVPISTFAWMAAWLSNARLIILPVFGLFNPDQFPDHDLLPVGDARYLFFKFPVHHAVPVSAFAEAHQALDATWNEISSKSLILGSA
jgi:hypothetical protein